VIHVSATGLQINPVR